MNTKLGFYSVNNIKFNNKLQAILYANLTKSDISWTFNNDKLDYYNWTEEPKSSLDYLYKRRAQQIREENDYVIIMASGGADSTNVLTSFLNNNILVDEIVIGAPLSGLKNWKINVFDTSPDNTISETMLAQLPLMNKISTQYPNIRITLHDYFEDILNLKTDEWIYEASSHWLHFSGTTRHELNKFSHIKNLAESGKKVAVVYGIDKPIICRAESGNLYTVIPDTVVNIVTPHFKEMYSNVETILFYYSPDLPELMIKQAHEVCRYIYKPENFYAKSLLWDRSKSLKFQSDPNRSGNWQRAIIPCIYPGIRDRFQVWQAQKQSTGFRGGFEIDAWILKLFNREKFVQMVESDLKLFVKNIDKKYFLNEDKWNGFNRFYAYWKVGHEQNFKRLINSEVNTDIIYETI